MEANQNTIFVTNCFQFFIVEVGIDITNFFYDVTRIITLLKLLGK